MAPTAVEWFADASPMLATTTESAGHGVDRPTRAALAGEREADRARQVRCDGGGLRYHVQVPVPEDLVPPAGDRLGRGCGAHAEQDVGDAVVTRPA